MQPACSAGIGKPICEVSVIRCSNYLNTYISVPVPGRLVRFGGENLPHTDKEDNMIFTASDFLKWLRISHQETRKQMADRLKVSTYMIRNREEGLTKIDKAFAEKVIEAYQLTGLPEELLRKLTQVRVVELTQKEKITVGNLVADYERSANSMDKKEITNVMAELGCPLAQSTPPNGGGRRHAARKTQNVIDLRTAAKGYDGSMDWHTWVDFMLASYNLKQGRPQSKAALIKKVFQAAFGEVPQYPSVVYVRASASRARIEKTLVRMVQNNEIVFDSDTAATRKIAERHGVPLHVATRMVYDRMMPAIDWTRRKLAYMEENGSTYPVDRRVLVAHDAELIKLFHQTAEGMVTSVKAGACPMLQEEPVQAAL